MDDDETAGHTPIAVLRTDLHACSVEAIDSSSFLCGLYELDEAEQKRNGRLIVCDLDATFCSLDEADELADDLPKIVTSGSVETDGGVLDCKVTGNTAAAALSTGRLDIFAISKEMNQETSCVDYTLDLKLSRTSTEDGLFLSLDWSSGARGYYPQYSSIDDSAFPTHHIAVSTQTGSVKIYDLNDTSGSHALVSMSDAHSIYGENVPAWIVAYDPFSGGTRLASGGDDCCLHIWDIRTGCSATTLRGTASDGTVDSSVFLNSADEGSFSEESEPSGTVVMSNKRSHTAGVTSAQWNPFIEHQICV